MVSKFLSEIQINLIMLMLITTSCMAQQTTIYLIGDSTMSNKKQPETNPEHGWGQVLPQFFTSQVKIDNRAVNGRSSRSFITENRWDSILKTLKKGDYVFIQFGHNDQKVNDPKRYTNPHTTYRHNLIKFVLDTREKGATPVLFSSIVRRFFNEHGTLVDTHGQYPLETRLVAQAYHVPFIDLQYFTEQLEESFGVEGSKKLHLHFEPGENSFYKNGKHDNTHLSKLGANKVAKLAVNALKTHVKSLEEFIK
ncbi:rhamnogalacturonan acetylesterase [Algibacter amylolyticus]|uniref:Rhamnogalacturonan acetylesterase n=1 Tax=Algibacter amylolyticus TaxID=1608400 RepID=A0A5M7BF56_9FLAO|nr:rhamnogalacturonan acetylesterase [Algibacter amylolyticus]KAA5827992.1 rhamnogalacturonan acetylesterase [Algibacter amylolyticus]MBB5267232.1 lysophospholipase L1-like esterase [Algibacter amylolyticus]TSJ82237.1 rhamnogalacturonan acetylesterase [Algibacter amylolyticus]